MSTPIGNTPKVSILMAVHNGLPYLQETLDSLLQQTFSDFELVVVDDTSTDNTPLVLSEYAKSDSRIIILRNERNLKLPGSLNRGLRECKALLVARADADDVYLPERLEKQVEFMDAHPEVGVLGAACREIDAKGRIQRMCRFPAEDKLIRFEMPFITRISHPSVIFRKDLVLNVGGYDENFWTGQDFDLWARLLPLTRFANITEPLWHYRILDDSISRSRGIAGVALVRPVSQRLLSAYLERELAPQEVEAILMMYRSWGTIRSDLIGMGVNLCWEYLKKARMREDEITVRTFKKNLANALLRQSIYQTWISRVTSLKLLFDAMFFGPGEVISFKGVKQVLRLLTPWRLFQAVRTS